MSKHIHRSKFEPSREGLSTDQKWHQDDKGLICCWEKGRKEAMENPELSQKALNGELPPLGWKGGVEKTLKSKKKIGTFFYLATWQGLRNDDLDIDFSTEPMITCTRTGVTVTFTGDFNKYADA